MCGMPALATEAIHIPKPLYAELFAMVKSPTLLSMTFPPPYRPPKID
jgi:hypothetical protein